MTNPLITEAREGAKCSQCQGTGEPQCVSCYEYQSCRCWPGQGKYADACWYCKGTKIDPHRLLQVSLANALEATEADNAALLERARHDPDCEFLPNWGNMRYPEFQVCDCILSQDHPGAALLAELAQLRRVKAASSANHHFVRGLEGHECELCAALNASDEAGLRDGRRT